MPTTREKLSLLWIFLFLNFIFCDVFTLFYAPSLGELMTGVMGGMVMDQSFLLIFSILMELGLVMVLVSRLAAFNYARWANLAIGAALFVVQAGSVLTPGLTMHYVFFSLVELATLLWILLTAWNWREEA